MAIWYCDVKSFYGCLLSILLLCTYTTQIKNFEPKKQRKFVFAFSNDGFPANFLENEVIMGQSVAMVEKVCQLAGKHCDSALVNRRFCWDTSPEKDPPTSPALDYGFYDVCANYPRSPQRLLNYQFSRQSFFKTPSPSIIVRQDSNITVPHIKFCNQFVVAYADNVALTPECAAANGLFLNDTLFKAIPPNKDLVTVTDKLVQMVLRGSADLALVITRFLRPVPGIKKLMTLDCRQTLDLGLNIMVAKDDDDIISWWDDTLLNFICNDTSYDSFCDDLKHHYGGEDPLCNQPGTDVDCRRFGGPALKALPRGRTKPLRIDDCQSASSCNSSTMIVCGGNTVVLKCRGNSKIRILSANYGRTTPKTEICPQNTSVQPDSSPIRCISLESDTFITDICDGQNNCSLNASDSLFTDFCPRVPKYLEVKYFCQYMNKSCEVIDECGNSPCKNGLCELLGKGFVCVCNPGWIGEFCDTDIDECSSSPCQNGGQCQNLINSYNCTCQPGYTGAECQTDIDECSSSPCRNGGGCNDLVNTYNCSCVPGYTGSECETDIDECSSSPCQNGGQCHNVINSYNCTCQPGYTGAECQTDIDECSSSPCQNGGQCKNLINSYNCTCQLGYTGAECQTDIDECFSSPCQNGGQCKNLINSYSCTCKPGYSGTQCETGDGCVDSATYRASFKLNKRKKCNNCSCQDMSKLKQIGLLINACIRNTNNIQEWCCRACRRHVFPYFPIG